MYFQDIKKFIFIFSTSCAITFIVFLALIVTEYKLLMYITLACTLIQFLIVIGFICYKEYKHREFINDFYS